MTADDTFITLKLLHDDVKWVTDNVMSYSDDEYTYIINSEGIELFRLAREAMWQWNLQGPFLVIREGGIYKVCHMETMFIGDIRIQRSPLIFPLHMENIGNNIVYIHPTAKNSLKDMFIMDKYMHDIGLELEDIIKAKMDHTKCTVHSIGLLSETANETIMKFSAGVINHRVYTSIEYKIKVDIQSGKINLEENI